LAKARAKAHKLFGMIEDGIDVHAEKVAKRREKKGTVNFSEVTARYINEFAKKRQKAWAQKEWGPW
jgi:hypothetical protein